MNESPTHMHEHDQNLIMAVAEGTLDGPAADAAAIEINACHQCREDLELQRFALDAMASMASAQLSEVERARLHRTVQDELGVVAPQPATRREPGRAAWYRLPWVAVASAAAVLLAIVIIAPALNLIGSTDDADTAEIALATTTTIAAEDGEFFARPESLDEGTDSATQLPAATAAPATTAAPSIAAAPETTSAPSETLSATAESAGDDDALGDTAWRQVLAFGDIDTPLQSRLNPEAGDLYLFGDVLDEGALSNLDSYRLDSFAIRDCTSFGIEELGSGFDGFPVGIGELAGTTGIVHVYRSESGEAFTIIHDAGDCSVLLMLP